MNFEFVEFYPEVKTKGYIVGTCHVYLVDIKMDLRGIVVLRKGQHVKFRIPMRITTDPETKKQVAYPVINFMDFDLMKELYAFLQEKAKDLVLERTKDMPGVVGKDKERNKKPRPKSERGVA